MSPNCRRVSPDADSSAPEAKPAGFGSQTWLDGIHDPLYATVLVIESGDNSIALVTCDGRSLVSTRVGDLAKKRLGIKNTLIDVVHDHSGPLT